jgi:ADP-ribose pyrophosphatase
MTSKSKWEQDHSKTLEKTTLHKGRILEFCLEKVKIDEKIKTYEIVHHPGACVIIPIDDKGDIVLVKQFRRGAKKILLELPAGTLHIGEDIMDCAQRELQEEIGMKAEVLEPFGSFYSTPGFCDEFLHLIVARNLTISSLPKDEDEHIDTVTLPILEVKKMVFENQIQDAKTIIGILKYLCAY